MGLLPVLVLDLLPVLRLLLVLLLELLLLIVEILGRYEEQPPWIF